MPAVYIDNRAVPKRFLDELKYGTFKYFIDLVRENDKLELCFRGNSINNKNMAIIYFNNHVAFELSGVGRYAKVMVNLNHAKYTKDYKEKLSKLYISNVKFDKNKKIVKQILPKECYKDIESLKDTWELLKGFMDDFFLKRQKIMIILMKKI